MFSFRVYRCLDSFAEFDTFCRDEQAALAATRPLRHHGEERKESLFALQKEIGSLLLVVLL
jgi:hypothetical protein